MKEEERLPVQRKGKQPLFEKHPRMANNFIQAIGRGNYITDACKSCGFGRETYYGWKKKAKEGKEPYKTFIDKVEKAEAEFIDNALQGITNAGDKNWQALAWILERRHQDKFGKQEHVKVEKDTSIDINIHGISDRDEAKTLMHEGKTIEVVKDETQLELE